MEELLELLRKIAYEPADPAAIALMQIEMYAENYYKILKEYMDFDEELRKMLKK